MVFQGQVHDVPLTLALLAMGRGAFDTCLQTMPALAHNLIRLLTHRLRLANAQIETLARQDVFGRVARQLLALAATCPMRPIRTTIM